MIWRLNVWQHRKMYVTYYISKDKVSNDQKQFEECVMTRIVHTP